MKVGGADYVRKKSLGAINAAAGFTRALQPYDKPQLKFKRMCELTVLTKLIIII